MALIEKIKISGIRSFSEDQEGLIEFQTPLTMIAGANGSGKTTIIECLRYITSNSKPPGCGTSFSQFVHDPRVSNKKTVKAEVELTFTSKDGSYIAAREMEASYKRGKSTTQTLDCSVVEENSGRRSSIKTEEMDEFMIRKLGVPKTILENVIFCHQEEGNWPFDTGGKLKAKFDNIFETSSYTNALEEMKSVKDCQIRNVELLKKDLEFLRAEKQRAEQWRRRFDDNETEIIECKRKICKLEEESKQIEKQLEEVKNKEDEAVELKSKIVIQQSLYNKNMKDLQDLLPIVERIPGTYEELVAERDGLDRQLEEEEERLKDRIEICTNEIENLNADRSELLNRCGQLTKESEIHKSKIRERDELINNVVKQHKISDLPHGPYEPGQVLKFLKDHEDYCEKAEKKKIEFIKEAAVKLIDSGTALSEICNSTIEMKKRDMFMQKSKGLKIKESLKAVKTFCEKYGKKILERQGCPLCNRDFETVDDNLLDEHDTETTLARKNVNDAFKEMGELVGHLTNVEEALADLESDDRISKDLEPAEAPTTEFAKIKIQEKDEQIKSIEEQLVEHRLQSQSVPEDQKAELTSPLSSLEDEIKTAEQLHHGILKELNILKTQKASIEQRQDVNDERVESKLEEIKRDQNIVRLLNEEIDRYIDGRKEDVLLQCQEKLEEATADCKSKEESKEKFYQDLEKIAVKRIARERQLDDNIRLLKTKVEVEKEKKVIDDLKRDLAIIGNVSAIRKERENLERERTEVLCKKKKFEGGLDQLERNQEQEGKDSCKYANAELNFQKKKLELEATERVIKDLEDCYKVLNKELTSFHEMKMTEINTIIKDYWIAIYKGQDIDTVKILAEEESGKTRRTYNYRVVMVKGSTELDMRGRCSAGQKVLASILIRLALAEAFCIDCGILALDEPTTNLDEDNVQSLASTLKEIIARRQEQGNFQLLIITHDEKFVCALGQSDYVDHFYEVYKDESGYSKIRRRRVNELSN